MEKRNYLISLSIAVLMILAATWILPELCAEADVKEAAAIETVAGETAAAKKTVRKTKKTDFQLLCWNETENSEETGLTFVKTEELWKEAYSTLLCEEEKTIDNLITSALAEAKERELELLRMTGDHLVTYHGERFIITDDEYQVLLRIVEAEAPAEDVKGKMLVANVILNRVLSERFPNTIGEVVFQKKQFAPIADGNYWRVTVSDETREAVELAVSGEDESRGALFFMARGLADPRNVKWFDKSLKFLFKHGVHEFFNYK